MNHSSKQPVKLFASRRRFFPDPKQALELGLVDINDDVSVERLLEAYSFGIFPWPQEGTPVIWFCPEERGVLDFCDLHWQRSFLKFLRHSSYEVTFNQKFSTVIETCARIPRAHEAGTWITSKMIQGYIDFHQAGYAHSVECWHQGELVGGLYGVYVGGVFAGESMFHFKDNASKVCLAALIEQLRAHGLQWMDIQMVSPYLASVGGKYISRAQFLRRLALSKRRAKPLTFLPIQKT